MSEIQTAATVGEISFASRHIGPRLRDAIDEYLEEKEIRLPEILSQLGWDRPFYDRVCIRNEGYIKLAKCRVFAAVTKVDFKMLVRDVPPIPFPTSPEAEVAQQIEIPSPATVSLFEKKDTVSSPENVDTPTMRIFWGGKLIQYLKENRGNGARKRLGLAFQVIGLSHGFISSICQGKAKLTPEIIKILKSKIDRSL